MSEEERDSHDKGDQERHVHVHVHVHEDGTVDERVEEPSHAREHEQEPDRGHERDGDHPREPRREQDGGHATPRNEKAKQGENDAPLDRKSPEARERMKKTGRLVTMLGVVLAIVAALAVLGIWMGKRHARSKEEARRSGEADKGPVVLVARVAMSPANRELTLTADVRSLYQTTLYAKVSGYVRDISVDKGDHAKRGQVLGIIESPETDQAVMAAKSSSVLRAKLAERARRLAPAVMSQQDLDTATSNLDVAQAGLKSATAMQEYEVIRAPFDGIITARYVDPGALMPAATGGTQSALPFVDMADPDTLRVDAYVGQDLAVFVKVGDPVTIWQDARLGVIVHATVTRTSAALDARSRTMLVEAQVDNRPYGILPGTFANMALHVETPPRAVIPAEALVTRDGHNMVARVEAARVHFVPVTLGLIDSRTVQIGTGVSPGDVVALNVPTELDEGGAIQAKERAAAGSGGDPNENKAGARSAPESKGGGQSQGEGNGKTTSGASDKGSGGGDKGQSSH